MIYVLNRFVQLIYAKFFKIFVHVNFFDVLVSNVVILRRSRFCFVTYAALALYCLIFNQNRNAAPIFVRSLHFLKLRWLLSLVFAEVWRN